MTPSARALWWLYLAAAFLTTRCAAISAEHGALWYAAGLYATGLLLLVALTREYLAADDRRAAARRAERAARLRALQDERVLSWQALERSCCLRGWESRGAAHDPCSCTRKDENA
ncbi:hypothetical protein ABZZ79_27840 [Streptomyces sp. NPDC006458]|uniref:hypothetical protein n=1 Tax=Streptomyces sp. NPDC006458 TaxID=3154302 RepID=UPI0033BF92E8